MAGIVIVGAVVIGILVVVPLSMRVQKAAKYSYTNARARGMAAKLAPEALVLEYCDYGISEIVTDLESREGYRDLAGMIGEDFTVEHIQQVLNVKSLAMTSRLVKAVPRMERAFFEHLARRMDYQNVRILVRLKMNGKFGSAYARLLTPSKVVPKDHMEDFLACSLEELWVKLRFTEFKELVEKHLDVEQPAGFEKALDHAYFERLLVLARRTGNHELVQYARRLVDVYNVSALSAFRDEDECVPGGLLPSSKLWELKQAKDGELAGVLEGTHVSGEADSLREVRVLVEREVHQYGRKLMSSDPMSLNSALGYLILKEVQINNLKRILKLKASGASEEALRSVVV